MEKNQTTANPEYAYGRDYLAGHELADGSVAYYDACACRWYVAETIAVELLGRNLARTSGYTTDEWREQTDQVDLDEVRVQDRDGDTGIVSYHVDGGVVVVRWLQGVTTSCALSELSVFGGGA